MYALIAISRLCQEESLRDLKDQRHSTPFNQAWDKKFGAVGAMAPAPLSLKSRGREGRGGGSHTRTGPGRPPCIADCRVVGRLFESWSADCRRRAAMFGRPGFEPPTQKPAVGCITIRSLLARRMAILPTAWS